MSFERVAEEDARVRALKRRIINGLVMRIQMGLVSYGLLRNIIRRCLVFYCALVRRRYQYIVAISMIISSNDGDVRNGVIAAVNRRQFPP